MLRRSLLLLFIPLLFSGMLYNKSDDPVGPEPVPGKIRGVSWVGGDSIAAHNIAVLANYNVAWISQTPFGFQPAYNQPDIHFGDVGWYWGERAEGIVHTHNLAQRVGIRTMLKPHLWMRRSGGKWRSDIEMENARDWAEWFANYERFILYYARLAEQHGVEMLCIGTELYHPATSFPEEWKELIACIRDVYSGQLTYAANFYREFEEITWWSELDYIGVQGYFPLSDMPAPSANDLASGWQPHLRRLERVAEKYGRPVLFTEIGYRNDPLAAAKPWLWPSQLPEDHIVVDDELQADCYRAFFAACWNNDFVAGVFFWKWHHSTWKYRDYTSYTDSRRRRLDSLVRAGAYRFDHPSRGRIFFCPRGREAEMVLEKNFCKDNVAADHD